MDLRARFYALWERLGARGAPEEVFDDLIARYREPHRRYHNETHWEFGLSQLDLLVGSAPHPDWVEFAFDYHDGVYVIGAADNEERSAGLAIGTLKKARVPGHIQSLVGGYIMITKPGQEPSTADQRVMADIDLAILGQARPVFVEPGARGVRGSPGGYVLATTQGDPARVPVAAERVLHEPLPRPL